jgi:hypothetical protein
MWLLEAVRLCMSNNLPRMENQRLVCNNINNPHLAIWATQLRGYTYQTNAEQVSIVKIQTD